MRARALLPITVLLVLTSCSPSSAPSGSAGQAAERREGNPIGAAQAALTFPIVGLGEALIRVEQDLDSVRHEAPRGEPMKTAAGELAVRAAELRQASAQVQEVLRDLDGGDPVVLAAESIVGDLVDVAGGVADAADAEAAFATQLADIDVTADLIVTGWDRGGSPAELRTAMEQLAADAGDLGVRAEALDPNPTACPELRDNRVRWAGLLSDRSGELADLVDVAGSYDASRDEFGALPYGEDRREEDAEERPCWLANSPVAGAGDAGREAVDELRALFSG